MDELRARHVRLECHDHPCDYDGQPYPCDFIRADDERRAAVREATTAGIALRLADDERRRLLAVCGLDVERVHRLTCRRLIEHEPGSDSPYLWPCTKFAREYAALDEVKP